MAIEQSTNAANLTLSITGKETASCHYSYAYDYLQAYVSTTIERKAKLLFQSNGQIADYRQVFDRIANHKDIAAVFKTLLLHKYFVLIADNFSKPDFERYYKRVQSEITDPLLLADINERFVTATYKNNKPALLSFMDKNKEVQNLQAIIKKNKNKVIYIDF